MDGQTGSRTDGQTDNSDFIGPSVGLGSNKGVSKLLTNPIKAMEKRNMKKCKVLSLKTRK